MERFRRFLICPLLAAMVMLSGCLYDPEKLEAKNNAELEEKKAVLCRSIMILQKISESFLTDRL